jgi:hypothetical protein
VSVCPHAFPSRLRNDGKRSLCFQVFALDESTAKLLKKVSEPL